MHQSEGGKDSLQCRQRKHKVLALRNITAITTDLCKLGGRHAVHRDFSIQNELS